MNDDADNDIRYAIDDYDDDDDVDDVNDVDDVDDVVCVCGKGESVGI